MLHYLIAGKSIKVVPSKVPIVVVSYGDLLMKNCKLHYGSACKDIQIIIKCQTPWVGFISGRTLM